MGARILALATLTGAVLASAVAAQDLVAPRLGAASNFGQGWQPEMFKAARALAVTDFRDAVYWRDVEKTPGIYDFNGARRDWPDRLPDINASMSLTVNNGHPLWDAGHTPASPEAVAAFAAFAAAAVTHFAAIDAVEVGNEMNSDTFVSGPGWDGDLRTRAGSYTALLVATAGAVKAARPGTRILGGAAHSIPLAWFAALFEAGAAQYMDALVIHPYGVAPELLAGQIAALRRLPEAATLPIEVTEFGHKDATRAPAYLLQAYCQMALSGVTRAVWYPLNPRGDGLTPLLTKSGEVTETGRVYRFIAAELAGKPVSDAAPDPFTYGCRFGPDRVALWGAPRALFLHAGTKAQSATGDALSPPFTLSMTAPLVLTGADGMAPGYDLAEQQIIADSLHQFAYDGTGDPFQRLVSTGARTTELEMRPGQEKNGVPWVPYLGTSKDGVLRAGADWVLPSRPSAGPLDVVLRYRAPQRLQANLYVEIAPSSRSEDGVELTIRAGKHILLRQTVTEAARLGPLPVDLRRRSDLDVIVGPGETARGDVTRLRVTLRKP